MMKKRIVIAGNYCRIRLYWTFRNHLNEIHDYSEEFLHVNNFWNYLRWSQETAMQLYYYEFMPDKKPDPELLKSARRTNVKLSIVYVKQTMPEIFLNSVDELKDFLAVHPVEAKDLLYE